MDQSNHSRWGKDQLEILGGSFAPHQWDAFLKAWKWPEEKRWGVWEYVSDFSVNSGELPAVDRLNVLERVDLFCQRGHLSARRDGDTVLWHFIGDPGLAISPPAFDAESYWKCHPADTFERQELKTAMLWGRKEKHENNWHEDRLGWARLNYPGLGAPHAQLTYWQFTHAGQVAFIWLTGLQDFEEE